MKFANRIDNVKPSAIRAAGKLIAAREGCISFAAGYPASVLMPVEKMRLITDDILSKEGDTALQYGMTKGYAPLLDKVVELMAEKDVTCGHENIQVTTGSQQGIFITALAFLNEGDTIITEKPTYLGALSSFAPFKCNYKGIDADDQGMKMDELEKALAEDDKIKLIYAVPNFSNPTGKTWPLERRKRLLELANKYDVMILEDNPYGEIRFEGETVPAIKSMDTENRVIYLGSFSKILFAGLRVGFVVADKEVADKYELLKQGIDLQSNQFAQVQINEFLNRHSLNDQINSIIEVYGKKRDLMVKLIDETFPKSIKRTNPEGGMFIWLTLPEGVDATVLCEKAIEEIAVGFVPGGSFFTEKGYENTIRLNFSTVDEDMIQEGITRLGKFFVRELG